jgi:PKD repeat protein
MVTNASGQPAKNALVALQIDDSEAHPVMYRTLSVGNPTGWEEANISTISITDASPHHNPINVIKVETSVTHNMNASFHATVQNPGVRDIHPLVIMSLVDSSLTPLLIEKYPSVPILAGKNTTVGLIVTDLPSWTSSGVASIICDAYSDEPSSGGYPYAAEKVGYVLISRYEQGISQFQVPSQSSPLPQGEFSTSFRIPPDRPSGSYLVYAVARLSAVFLSPLQTALFNVSTTQYPPNASFSYSPVNPYRNMSVAFDASFSYAEGPGNTIVSYAWNWGDGKQDVTANPLINHKFTGAPSKFLVTLNVTDNNGLWTTESTSLYTKSPNPTASLSCPSVAFANQTVTFDGSSSKPGWDESKGTYSTIAQYKWNFGDGTGDFVNSTNLANPAVNHSFTHIGNYTVTLTATSAAGLSNSTTKILRIIKGSSSGLVGDITGPNGVPDGIVDTRDLALVARCYGATPGASNWDPRADITGPTYLVPDGLVDTRDLALVAKHYGDHL